MDRNLDSLIKKAFKIRYEETEYPSSQEVWENITKRLRKQRRTYMLNKLKSVIAVCVILSFLTGLFFSYQPYVMAFANRVIKTMMEITENTVQIHKKVVSSDEAGMTDYMFGRNIDDPRIGEAQKAVHFRLLIPNYLPDTYKLSNVEVLNKYEKKETVTMFYLKSIDDGTKSSFEIVQRSFSNCSEITMNKMRDENTKIEYIDINGAKCILIGYSHERHALLWDKDNVSYEISGMIGRQEVIKVAESMK